MPINPATLGLGLLPFPTRLADRGDGTYDVHFEKRYIADMRPRPGLGLEVLVVMRPRLAKLGLRPRWTGSQAQAIRLEPGPTPRGPRSVDAVAALARWGLDLVACDDGRRFAAGVTVDGALEAAEADPTGSMSEPAGYARWAARGLTGDDGPSCYSDNQAARATAWAVELLREAARWVHGGDAPRVA